MTVKKASGQHYAISPDASNHVNKFNAMEYTRALDNTLSDRVRQSNAYRLREKLLQCDIDIEVNKINFHLPSDGHSVIFTLNNITDSFALFKKVVELSPSIDEQRIGFEEFLRNNGLTIYIQNRHFGILGRHANKILA